MAKFVPFFSLISLNCCGASEFSSCFGVTASSSLPLLAALDALALDVFFFVEDSAAGVFGVVNLSLVAVFGVFAGLASQYLQALCT